jgi:hypothetical protein
MKHSPNFIIDIPRANKLKTHHDAAFSQGVIVGKFIGTTSKVGPREHTYTAPLQGVIWLCICQAGIQKNTGK